MRLLIVLLIFVFTAMGFGQEKFVFNETGLSPKHIISRVHGSSKTQLFDKALKWIKATYKNPDIEVDNQVILLTGIEENAIQANKQYFHLKYKVKVTFEKGQCTFKPISIKTKANSKYDMGWKEIDLKNDSEFFKKGKPIKKTKSYVKMIPEVLNKLNSNLYNYLVSE